MAIFTCTRTLSLVAIFLMWPTLVQANIGETMPQLRARYGSAKDMGGQMLFEVRLVDGQFVPSRDSTDTPDHFSVTVYFDGARSAMEVFTRNTSDPLKANLSEADINAILAAAADGRTWDEGMTPTGRRTWVRSDKRLVARFSPNRTGKPDDASVMVIMLNEK